jgi:hypothetical protein
MASYDLKALEGYKHAPNLIVRNLAAAAHRYLTRLEEALEKVRNLEEQITEAQVAADPVLLVIVDHHGSIDVRAKAWLPVAVVEMHDAGSPVASEDRARSRTPWKYRELWDGVSVARGGPAVDRYKLAYIEGEVLIHRALSEAAKEIKEANAAPAANG